MALLSSLATASSPIARALAALGRLPLNLATGFVQVASLIGGALSMALAGRLIGQRVSLDAVLRRLADIGFLALPSTALYGLAIGLVFGILLETLLRLAFGLLETVIGVATSILVEQVAPLFVGIMVAARSGSALAADLSSMVAAKEIDALRSMGLSPERLLVAPAILGGLLATPLLIVFMIAFVLLTLAIYLNLTLGSPLLLVLSVASETIQPSAMVTALAKGLLFGALIAAIAGSQGLAGQSSVRTVGHSVTRALVATISTILLSNAVLTLVF